MEHRCSWVNPANPAYVRYHDEEWGKAEYDDRKLFAMLVLETFQAGLSWECVLRKRSAFYRAFDGLDPEIVRDYDCEKIRTLAENPAIIRNRRKIEAAVENARVFLEIAGQWGSFSAYLWHWTRGETVFEHGKTRSELSDRVSEDLKRRGMHGMGSVTVYAYLQAVGIVNGHEPSCFLFRKSPSSEEGPEQRGSEAFRAAGCSRCSGAE